VTRPAIPEPEIVVSSFGLTFCSRMIFRTAGERLRSPGMDSTTVTPLPPEPGRGGAGGAATADAVAAACIGARLLAAAGAAGAVRGGAPGGARGGARAGGLRGAGRLAGAREHGDLGANQHGRALVHEDGLERAFSGR